MNPQNCAYAHWTSREFSRRLALLLVFAILVVGVVTSCSSAAVVSITASSSSSSAITVVATATSNEPKPELPKAVEAEVDSLATASTTPGGATVRIITGDSGPIYQQDVTPVRGKDVEHSSSARTTKIQAGIDMLNRHLANTTAIRPGLDLLSLLDRASTVPGSPIDLISSGLSTNSPLDFRMLGFDFNPDHVIDSVARQGLLPDLTNRHVTFYGLGIVAGSNQARLPAAARKAVMELYIRLCQRANAASCDVGQTDNSQPPTASLLSPVVGIPASYTERGCPVFLRLDNTSALHFEADSAVLPPNASSVLLSIVQAALKCGRRISVTGFIADTGSGRDDQDLSGQRARAVATELVRLGLPASQLGEVVGRGTADPVIPNFTATGQFAEDKAELNRRVELTFVRS